MKLGIRPAVRNAVLTLAGGLLLSSVPFVGTTMKAWPESCTSASTSRG